MRTPRWLRVVWGTLILRRWRTQREWNKAPCIYRDKPGMGPCGGDIVLLQPTWGGLPTGPYQPVCVRHADLIQTYDE